MRPLAALFKPIASRTSAIERGLVLTSLVVGVVLAAMAVAVYQVSEDELEAGKRSLRANEVAVTLDKLQIALRDGELAGRDYLAGGRRIDRERFEAARFNARLQLAALNPLAGDVPAQAERLAQVEPLVNRRFTQFSRAIELHDTRGAEGDGARSLVDEIDPLIVAMQKDEDERIKTFRAMQREAQEKSLFVMVGALGILTLLSLVLWMLLKIEFGARHGLEHRLIESATVDELTGAANRREFDRQLLQEWAFKNRYGTALSLIVLDIDHFKALNARWGHIAGDAVLREIARRIHTRLRNTETLARYGGEEFALIVPQYLNDAMQLAEQLRERIAAEPFKFSEGVNHMSIRVTISVGVAEASDVSSARELLAAADGAMYAAKTRGRDCVAAHHGDGLSSLSRATG